MYDSKVSTEWGAIQVDAPAGQYWSEKVKQVTYGGMWGIGGGAVAEVAPYVLRAAKPLYDPIVARVGGLKSALSNVWRDAKAANSTSRVAGGTGSTSPAWEAIGVRQQDVLVQSGELTCGQACAAYIAQQQGLTRVTEKSLIDDMGSSATKTPASLGSALEAQTGVNWQAGSLGPRAIPNSGQVPSFVDQMTNGGQSPFSTLFYGPNTPINEGHWVVVKGLDELGNVKILDPAGMNYTQTPSGFLNAWRYHNLIYKR